MIDHRPEVGHELRGPRAAGRRHPVVGLRVVRPQHDDHVDDGARAGVGDERRRRRVLALVDVGQVAGRQQRRAVAAEVHHLHAAAEQPLQVRGVGLAARRGEVAVGDAVADAGDVRRLARLRPRLGRRKREHREGQHGRDARDPGVRRNPRLHGPHV